jgi:hypothetical protein
MNKREVVITNTGYGVLTVQFLDQHGREFDKRSFGWDDAVSMYQNIQSWTSPSGGYLHQTRSDS